MGKQGKIHENQNHNTAGFDKNPQNINREGRGPSVKKQLTMLLAEDGKITIPKNQVIDVKDNGDVVLVLPKDVQLGMKLMSIAMGKTPANALKAIQMIMEQIDGKPNQPFENIHEKCFQWKEVNTDTDE